MRCVEPNLAAMLRWSGGMRATGHVVGHSPSLLLLTYTIPCNLRTSKNSHVLFFSWGFFAAPWEHFTNPATLLVCALKCYILLYIPYNQTQIRYIKRYVTLVCGILCCDRTATNSSGQLLSSESCSQFMKFILIRHNTLDQDMYNYLLRVKGRLSGSILWGFHKDSSPKPTWHEATWLAPRLPTVKSCLPGVSYTLDTVSRTHTHTLDFGHRVLQVVKLYIYKCKRLVVYIVW